jgi:hypothetical protein
MVHNCRLFLYVIASIVMCGYDAVATMKHIEHGVAAEANPLMDSLIQQNVVVFFLVKLLVTAFGLFICYNFSCLRTARIGIRMVAMIYALLCIYHALIIIFGQLS